MIPKSVMTFQSKCAKLFERKGRRRIMYKIKTNERNNQKATEFETKSLLYLLTKAKDHESVDLFIIDCFNDVTGASSNYQFSWDIQSKGVASLTPRTIGVALYTLFSNYVSDIDFGHYILYIPPVKDSYIEHSNDQVFDVSNFKSEKYVSLLAGLQDEIKRRNDPDVNTASNLRQIDEFLGKVIFVTDCYNKSDYIRSIVEFKNINQLDDPFLSKIFDEIRNYQALKKIKNVYGTELSSIQDAEKLGKTINRKDIELLVVNRVIGNDLFSPRGVPLYYVQEIQNMDEEDIKDQIQECQSEIGRTLFNKNNKKAFWLLLESIMLFLSRNSSVGIHTVAKSIDDSLKKAVFTLSDSALLYLIALVKEGIDNDNP